MIVKKIIETKGSKLYGGSMPDIDSDFPTSRRAEVKEYMDKRFGHTQVASVGTLTTLKLKGALKDLDRQLDNNVALANLITSIIDLGDETMLDLYKRAAKEPKLKEYIKRNSDIFFLMPSILNQPKTKSIHPCAVIVMPGQLTCEEWAPMRVQNGLTVSEWSGSELEEAGFLKEDILGLKQLDKFSEILELIKKSGKEIPNIYALPEDNEVYRYFSNGWNGDVFQMGTDSLAEYTRKLKPSCINDLIAIVALHRPGPMENHYHEIYVKCKNEGRQPEYLWGTEEITKDTYGLLVYQEQVMAVCREVGGLSEMEADDVRRAMGKKKLDVLLEWKERIKKGYLKKGAEESDFEHAWEAMLEFAKYSFNKSHSAVYGITGYICQWLKVHYPIEYWTVALSHSNEEKGLKFLSEIFATKGIGVEAPDINNSDITMTSDLKSKTIFWGLGSVKGIGEATAEQIIVERKRGGPYKSFADFYFRNIFKGSKVKKQTFEALITAGAFDALYGFKNEEQKRVSLINRFRIYKKIDATKAKRDLFLNGEVDSKWWWLLQQKKFTGLVNIDYKKLALEQGFSTEFLSSSELSTSQARGIFRSFGGYVVDVNIKSGAKGKFAIILIETNYILNKVMVWSEEFSEFKEQIEGCAKSLVLFTAELRFESKWTKGNQFTLKPNSLFKVLK